MTTVRQLAASCVILVLAILSVPKAAYAEMTFLSMQTGHSTVIECPGLQRVAVGNPAIAGVVPIGTARLIVNAKGPGHTTLIIWSGNGQHTYEITVSQQNYDSMAQAIRLALDAPDLQVLTSDRSIIVRGVVSDPGRLARLNDILGRFSEAGKAEGFVLVNAVTLAAPFGGVASEMNAVPGASDVRIDSDDKGNIIVSGHVHDRVAAQKVLELARSSAGPALTAAGKVIDRLTLDQTSQVAVRVYVLEIDQTGLKDLGIQLQSATPDDPVNPQHYSLGNPSFPLIEGGAAGIGIGAFFRTARLAPTLNLIQQEGHGRILSSPTLTTMPGVEATFMVGGEIPYAYSSGLGQVSIVFKDYGVKLDVTPTILADGSVETKVAPEVSDLDYQDGITQQGFTIPALKTSKLQTDLVTKPGESIIMGGLLRRIEQRDIVKIPLLGDIPILGQLFRSTRYQSSQTDVVFIMTPEILNR